MSKKPKIATQVHIRPSVIDERLMPPPMYLHKQSPAFKRLEAAEFCRVSPATFHRIGPPADVAIGRIRLWTIDTLMKWLGNQTGNASKAKNQSSKAKKAKQNNSCR